MPGLRCHCGPSELSVSRHPATRSMSMRIPPDADECNFSHPFENFASNALQSSLQATTRLHLARLCQWHATGQMTILGLMSNEARTRHYLLHKYHDNMMGCFCARTCRCRDKERCSHSHQQAAGCLHDAASLGLSLRMPLNKIDAGRLVDGGDPNCVRECSLSYK